MAIALYFNDLNSNGASQNIDVIIDFTLHLYSNIPY